MAGIKEACGVFGIYDLDGGNVVPSIYYGLTSLQHRGQESCGLAVSRTDGERGNVQFHKDLGLVSEVLREDSIRNMKGDLGIGHQAAAAHLFVQRAELRPHKTQLKKSESRSVTAKCSLHFRVE